jgi:hypothetical protein
MIKSKDSKKTGQCLCGIIKYEVTQIEKQMGHCHCSMCRKFHGAAFATFGEAKIENFKWLSGEDSLKSFIAPNGTIRKFCECCGSSLIFVPSNDSGEWVEFTLGTLDSKITVKPDAHIFTKFKANWYDISDDLPKYLEGRDNSIK